MAKFVVVNKTRDDLDEPGPIQVTLAQAPRGETVGNMYMDGTLVASFTEDGTLKLHAVIPVCLLRLKAKGMHFNEANEILLEAEGRVFGAPTGG